MAVKFTPNGFLDIATDPSDMASEVADRDEVSGEMRRCTNLQLDKMGVASTRHGSSKVNSSALDQTTAHNLVELAGVRYAFAGSKIYRNETSIQTGLFSAKWSAIKYNPYNSESINVFALNGTERIRIQGSTAYQWGMAAPGNPAVIKNADWLTGLTGTYNAKYTRVRKEGSLLVHESDPSDAASSGQALTDDGLVIICHHDFTDTQHTHLRTYRTLAGGNLYYQDQDVTLAQNVDYAVIHQWEIDDVYISGTGYKITRESASGQFTEQTNYESGTQGGYQRSDYWCQGFKPASSYNMLGIGFEIAKIGNPGDITVSIYNDDGGEPGTELGQTNLDASGITAWPTYGWVFVTLNATISLTQDTLYWLVLNFTSWDAWNYYRLKGYFNSGGTNQYGDGDEIFKYGDDLAALTDAPIYDMNFRIWEYTGTLNETQFSWEDDYSTASNQGDAINCFYWEPGLLVSLTADTGLGSQVSTENDRPPLGSFVFGPSFNGTCFIIKDNDLYYCLPKQPESWPVTYFLEVCSGHTPLIAGTIYETQVYVASQSQIYNIPGTGHTSWGHPLTMDAITGTVSAQCFLGIHGYGIFHLGNDGLYLYSDKDENITNARFKPIFDGDTVGSIPGMNKTYIANCWMVYFKSKLYFAYPESGSTYPDNMIVTNLNTERSVHFDFGGTAFPCAVVDEENDRLLAMDTSGYVWELEDTDATDDNGTAISWQIETKEFSDQLRKYFPRYARYDVTLNDGATAIGYVLLDGTSVQSHTLSTSRAIKKRLVTTGNGDRIALRITGTGPVDIFAAEVE